MKPSAVMCAETSQWPACLLFRWQPFSSGSFRTSHSECQANRGDNVLLGVSSWSTRRVSIPVPNAVLLLVAKAWRNAVSWRARAVFFRGPRGVRGWGAYKLTAARVSRFILGTFWAIIVAGFLLSTFCWFWSVWEGCPLDDWFLPQFHFQMPDYDLGWLFFAFVIIILATAGVMRKTCTLQADRFRAFEVSKAR